VEVRTHVNPHGGLKRYSRRFVMLLVKVRTHVNPHGGLKLGSSNVTYYRGYVRTHVNPHGGLKPPNMLSSRAANCWFGPTLILTED